MLGALGTQRAALAATLALALAPLAAPSAARAEPTTALGTLGRIRGTVEQRVNDTLVVRRYDGGTATVHMNPKTRMLIATPGRIRDIKPESYISVISEPEGADRAARRIAIYSPSERGFEAGTQPWDTGPDATLTGGWITERTGSGPVHVRLRNGAGTPSFTLQPETPTTQIGPGEKALLVPGADVVVFTRTAEKGLLDADTVAVGRLGAKPSL